MEDTSKYKRLAILVYYLGIQVAGDQGSGEGDSPIRRDSP
jgi:hypothetical protein